MIFCRLFVIGTHSDSTWSKFEILESLICIGGTIHIACCSMNTDVVVRYIDVILYRFFCQISLSPMDLNFNL